jgi:hypothetical protein
MRINSLDKSKKRRFVLCIAVFVLSLPQRSVKQQSHGNIGKNDQVITENRNEQKNLLLYAVFALAVGGMRQDG